jgi:hypothetical protein
MIVGQWICPGAVRLTFHGDNSFVMVTDGQQVGGTWTNQDWNLFLDLDPGPREDWRVAMAHDGPVLFRNWVSMDSSARDPYCEREAKVP